MKNKLSLKEIPVNYFVKMIVTFSLIISILHLTSCATVANSLLGSNTCSYYGCTNLIDSDCPTIFCHVHCMGAVDEKKFDKSIQKQIESYKKERTTPLR